MKLFDSIEKAIAYVKRRLNERSSLIAIGGAITVASALPGYWPVASLVFGVAAALVPDGTVAQ